MKLVRLMHTGSSNSTLAIGGLPCPHCGESVRSTADFNGYLLTLCMGCGAEL